MAGIYIHIPFCRQACNYCNFHFSTSVKLQNDFLNALLKEISIRNDYIGDENVNTIYFGGGTPSILPVASINAIIEKLLEQFPVEAGAEITLEANPDDIDSDRLLSWKQSGINRLSIGVQSFYERDLKWMNRAHDDKQALNSVLLAQRYGFSNLSIDLIYGTPGLNDNEWKNNLATATSLGVPHISCYALTVEPGTALADMIIKKKVQPVRSDDQARQFNIMSKYLLSNGYEHYEISNFAFPGMRSRHNSSYWNGSAYVGFGPSAHSFNGVSRQWNVANNALYINALKNGDVPSESELLDVTRRFNEYVMTSLRTMEGTDIDFAQNTFGDRTVDTLLQNSIQFIERGWMEKMENRLVLTQEGKLFADGIASDLFQLV
jgi:oxygen-independent coproporphyrinogen III oxidase